MVIERNKKESQHKTEETPKQVSPKQQLSPSSMKINKISQQSKRSKVNSPTDFESKLDIQMRDPSVQKVPDTKIQNCNVPYNTSIVNYGKTKRQLNLMDKDKILALHMQMDKRFDMMVDKEVEKIKS